MAEILAWKPLSIEQMTTAQRKFWAILQTPDNRTLTPAQIVEQAGYKSRTPWYRAIEDEAFRHLLESLGVVVQREYHEPEVRGKVPLAEDPDVEWEKDVVDVRRLVSDYPKHFPASQFKLHFSFLSNQALKAVVKRYLRARLGFWQPSTLRSYLRWLQPFLWNLDNCYPGIASFATLTTAMLEPVLTASFCIS